MIGSGWRIPLKPMMAANNGKFREVIGFEAIEFLENLDATPHPGRVKTWHLNS